MITECYIKGRFDNGVGKCAVVITEDVQNGEEKSVLHQVAWRVPESWLYNGRTIVADQYNCEILAATYAINWCRENRKPLLNLYSNTDTCQKWYFRQRFPNSREAAAKMYIDAKNGYIDALDKYDGKKIGERVYAEWISEDYDEAKYAEFNCLVNILAENAK